MHAHLDQQCTGPERYLDWRAVRPLTGNLGRTTVWRLQRAGKFPAPVPVSANRVAWRESDILKWQAGRNSALEAA